LFTNPSPLYVQVSFRFIVKVDYLSLLYVQDKAGLSEGRGEAEPVKYLTRIAEKMTVILYPTAPTVRSRRGKASRLMPTSEELAACDVMKTLG